MDQHRAARGITGILHGEGPAIRCANGPLHASPHLDHPLRGQRMQPALSILPGRQQTVNIK